MPDTTFRDHPRKPGPAHQAREPDLATYHRRRSTPSPPSRGDRGNLRRSVRKDPHRIERRTNRAVDGNPRQPREEPMDRTGSFLPAWELGTGMDNVLGDVSPPADIPIPGRNDFPPPSAAYRPDPAQTTGGRISDYIPRESTSPRLHSGRTHGLAYRPRQRAHHGPPSPRPKAPSARHSAKPVLRLRHSSDEMGRCRPQPRDLEVGELDPETGIGL